MQDIPAEAATGLGSDLRNGAEQRHRCWITTEAGPPPSWLTRPSAPAGAVDIPTAPAGSTPQQQRPAA
jgi:hypothetical protein